MGVKKLESLELAGQLESRNGPLLPPPPTHHHHYPPLLRYALHAPPLPTHPHLGPGTASQTGAAPRQRAARLAAPAGAPAPPAQAPGGRCRRDADSAPACAAAPPAGTRRDPAAPEPPPRPRAVPAACGRVRGRVGRVSGGWAGWAVGLLSCFSSPPPYPGLVAQRPRNTTPHIMITNTPTPTWPRTRASPYPPGLKAQP